MTISPLTLARRMSSIKPSPTLALSAEVARRRALGEDIIDLGAGEPDFDTPEPIKEAACRAIAQGKTKYTPVGGIPPLKEAIVRKFREENRLDYKTSQVMASVGAKQCIFNLALALVNPGDEVLIPAPYWVSYADIAAFAGGVPVAVETTMEEGFLLTPEKLEAAITPKTKLLILNSPNNPTGAVLSRDRLLALGEVLLAHPQVVICSDDIYEHLLYTPEGFSNILNACPDLFPRTVVVNGVSKAFAMTGWRLGYAAGPQELIEAMATIQSQSTSNPASISQWAALTALQSPPSLRAPMQEQFSRRAGFLFDALSSIPKWKVARSQGAFYSFPCVHEAMAVKGFTDDVAFARFLLEEAKVAVVPGSAFGAPGHVRLSFATGMENLQEAIRRIRAIFG